MPVQWKVALIIAVTVIAVLTGYPPQEKIKLGLDLRGGIHLLVAVETDEAIEAELEDLIGRVNQALDKVDVAHAVAEVEVNEADGRYRALVHGVASDKVDEARRLADTAIANVQGAATTALVDGVAIDLNATLVGSIRDRTVEQALNTIGERINRYGVAEPLLQRQGPRGERILVQLPGVDDPERVKRLIGQVAFLELKLVDSGPYPTPEAARANYPSGLPANLELVPGVSDSGAKATVWWVLEKIAAVTGRDLSRADASRDRYGQPSVGFGLNAEGARKFGAFTGANINKRLAVVLDNTVKTAPTIQGRISDSGEITNIGSNEESRDLALVLRAGALPAKISYLEQRQVGPGLGWESIQAGLRAALIGFVVVVGFMVVYYRGAGINAVVALTLNIVLVIGALAALKATLTLPGIAGFILTIGMAVDANVIIFERIREDLLAGKAARSAVDSGFAKAFWTIFDSNITTLIAALFLIQFGTGPVRGFAVTLSVGIIASMFTAIFVSRTLFQIFVFRGGRAPARLSI